MGGFLGLFGGALQAASPPPPDMQFTSYTGPDQYDTQFFLDD